MVAQEGWKLERALWPAKIERVGLEQLGQLAGRLAPADCVDHGARKGKVEHCRQSVLHGVHSSFRRIQFRCENLSKDMEVGDAVRPSPLQHRRNEGLPELRVHMFGRVDTETVDPEAIDPAAEYLDQPSTHSRGLAHKIIKAGKVAL